MFAQRRTKSRLTFLLIDDSLTFRRLLRKIVESHPDWHVAAEASDGLEGMELAISSSPDIVLVDINMPVMNGIEATRRLKKLFPNIRVITFSGYHDQEYSYASHRAGADGHFQKEELNTDCLERWVEFYFVRSHAINGYSGVL